MNRNHIPNSSRLPCETTNDCCPQEPTSNEINNLCNINSTKRLEQLAQIHSIFENVVNYRIHPTTVTFTFINSRKMHFQLCELIQLERVCCKHTSWLLNENAEYLTLILRADETTLSSLLQNFIPAKLKTSATGKHQ